MKTRWEAGITGAVIGVLCIFFVAGCTSMGTYLKWKQVDAAAMLKSEAGRQAYNTIRFETYGPKPQQLFGYFLYKDGIQVDTGTAGPVARIGKLTLAEVMDDYQNVEKANIYTFGSNLIVREIFRGNAVIGYTATDINIGVDIWDVTKEGGPTVLRLIYEDLRKERESAEHEREEGIGK